MSRADGDGAPSDGRRPWLLVIDTATASVVVAAASTVAPFALLGATTWTAGRTHGAQLLPAIGRLHGEANLRRSRIRGVIVGTGPGAFTGLRVGLATAKALAHELRIPIVGVSTGEALLRAAADPVAGDATRRLVLLLPAGPNDIHLVRPSAPPSLVPGGSSRPSSGTRSSSPWISQVARRPTRSIAANGPVTAWPPRSPRSAVRDSPAATRTIWPGSCRST